MLNENERVEVSAFDDVTPLHDSPIGRFDTLLAIESDALALSEGCANQFWKAAYMNLALAACALYNQHLRSSYWEGRPGIAGGAVSEPSDESPVEPGEPNGPTNTH